MFKVNNKDTRMTPMVSFWCLYCWPWTYFTSCSSVSIVNSEQVNAGWEGVFYWETLIKDISFIIKQEELESARNLAKFFLVGKEFAATGIKSQFRSSVLMHRKSFYYVLFVAISFVSVRLIFIFIHICSENREASRWWLSRFCAWLKFGQDTEISCSWA